MNKSIVQAPTKVAVSDCPVLFTHDGITYNDSNIDLDIEGSRFEVQPGDIVTTVAACWKPDIFMCIVQRNDITYPLVLRVASYEKLEYSTTDEARAEYEAAQEAAKAAKKAEAMQKKAKEQARAAKKTAAA